MPILKTEILGSKIEINYEESEKDKLEIIVEKFKERLSAFKDLEGKVSNSKILFLAALKAEDEAINNNLSQEIIKLKDKINFLKTENTQSQNYNSKALDELDKIEKTIKNLSNKILAQNNENN